MQNLFNYDAYNVAVAYEFSTHFTAVKYIRNLISIFNRSRLSVAHFSKRINICSVNLI